MTTQTIIIKTDKGGAAVIMDVKDYINEAYRQLNKDHAATNAKLVNDTTQRFKKYKLLIKKIAESFKVSNSKTPKFHMQPKIHKKDNPGQPVVSSVNCHPSGISKYED